MVGLLVVMMLAGGSQVLTSYNSKVLEPEGVTAELVLGGIDIHRSQIMAAARWTKPVKWTVCRS